MTRAKFTVNGSAVIGFEISGHSSQTQEDEEGRLVCAAVSSAAYMAANTCSDVIGARCTAEVEDGFMRFLLTESNGAAQWVLEGLRLHLNELAAQYGSRIQIIGGAEDVKG